MSRFRRSDSSPLFQSSWLTLSRHALVDPEGAALPHPVYTIDMGDWVNVLAITPARELVLVRQHRFGTEQDSLEIPGGMLDPDEPPLEAARRELEEETGFTAPRWRSLGWNHPNPALQSNKLYTFVAEDAALTHDTSLDPLEDCRVELAPLADLPAMLSRGDIRHALVLVALYQLLLEDRGLVVSAP
jgi:ADP-ribose pyrophosphatase